MSRGFRLPGDVARPLALVSLAVTGKHAVATLSPLPVEAAVNETQAHRDSARPPSAPAGASAGKTALDTPAPGRLPGAVWLIAGLFTALELALSGRYGFQQDELYFLVAGHHLAFGYVDQPPLAVLLTRTTDLFGVNPTAIRILPAFAGGAVVVITARL